MGRPAKLLPGIEALIERGLSARAIAVELGTTGPTVARWAARHNLKIAEYDHSTSKAKGRPGPRLKPWAGPNESLERVMQSVYGSSYHEVRALNDGLALDDKTSRVYKYFDQRQSAAKRGVGWEITLVEWLAVWDESGKWHMRGCRKDQYVMARYGDKGPYKVGNVEIITSSQNVKDYYAARRAAQVFQPAQGC